MLANSSLTSESVMLVFVRTPFGCLPPALEGQDE
jgi:hypothetical protein